MLNNKKTIVENQEIFNHNNASAEHISLTPNSSLKYGALEADPPIDHSTSDMPISIDEAERNINQQKVFFKNAGIASQWRQELLKLMLEIYKQDLYLDTFSIRKIQRCLDTLKNNPKSEETVNTLEALRSTSIHINHLHSVESRLDELQHEIIENQMQFQFSDDMVKSWFYYALETIAQLREAIIFQKEALRQKTKCLAEFSNLFDGTRNTQEIMRQASLITEELKCFIETAHCGSESVYCSIENRIENILRETQLYIEDPQISVYQQKEFFKKLGAANQIMSKLQKLLSDIYKPEKYQNAFSVLETQRCLDTWGENSNTQEAVKKLEILRNISVHRNELQAIGGSLSEMKSEMGRKQVQFRFSDVIVKNWLAHLLESIDKLEEVIQLLTETLAYKARQISEVKNLFDSRINDQEIVIQAKCMLEEFEHFAASAYLASSEIYSYIIEKIEILNNSQDIITQKFLHVSEPNFFVKAGASMNGDLALASRTPY